MKGMVKFLARLIRESRDTSIIRVEEFATFLWVYTTDGAYKVEVKQLSLETERIPFPLHNLFASAYAQ